MAHSYRLGLITWRYQARIPVWKDICRRGCAYTVLETVKKPGVYSAACGTVHYKEPLKVIRNKSRAWSRLQVSFCHDITMILQKAT